MIRLATPDDASAVHDIYAPIVRDTAISFEWEVPTVADMAGRITKVLADRPWLVLEEDGEILGYSYATTFRERRSYQWGTEVAIYVHENARGRGVGRKLYGALFEVLTKQNYCTVIAGATLPNPNTERLHLGIGFSEFGRYPAAGFKLGKWWDVVFWMKRLRELPADPTPIIHYSEIIDQCQL